MRNLKTLAVAAAVVALTSTAQATPIYDDLGVVGSAATITFDEQVFAPGKVLTYQYSADGIRMDPNLVYGFPVGPNVFPLLDGNVLRNFFPNNTPPFQGTTPFSLKFEDVQTRAAAAVNFVGGQGKATALLNGIPVDSFDFITPDANFSKFVGFKDVEFNEIRIDAPGLTGTVLLDNVQLGKASASIRNHTGLASVERTITFDEHVFAPGTVLTDEYADQGVRFSPNLVYGFPVTPDLFPPLAGNILRNFFPNGQGPADGLEPFSLLFDEDQTDVAFAMNFLGPGPATISAWLNGLLVRSFDVEAQFDPTDNFYLGFRGILFDEIRIDLPDGANTMLLDNIQFGGAVAVSEPGQLGLLALGALAFALSRRRPAMALASSRVAAYS